MTDNFVPSPVPLPAISDPDDAEVLVAKLLVDRAGKQSPLLRDMLFYAALPRSFDADLLASLVDRSREDPEFRTARQSLLEYSFLHRRGADGWALHDSIRQALLQLWLTSEDAPGDRDEALVRLEDQYKIRYAEQRTAMAHLAQLEELLSSVDPKRYRSLRDALEDRLIRSATEAVHTALRRSFEAGWIRLSNIYSDLEEDRRLHLCNLLIRSWAADDSIVTDDDRPLFTAWTIYFNARTTNGRDRWEEALEQLGGVTSPEAIDLKYATWYHSERARALRGLSRFHEAIDAVNREIAIHDEHHVDDTNSSTPWTQKAGLYNVLWDADAEIECYRHALRRAQETGSLDRQVIIRLGLAVAVDGSTDQQAALDELLRAIVQSRRAIGDTPTSIARTGVQRGALIALHLLGPRSARLCATLAEQNRELYLEHGDAGKLDVLLEYANALAQGGNQRRAAEIFERARDLAVERLPDRVWEVDADRAGQATALGTPMAGGELNTELLDRADAPTDRWNRARCLTNAAAGYSAAGAYALARERLATAEGLWREIGHERGLWLARVLDADLCRATGDIGGARAALANTGKEAAHGFESVRYECVARLALKEGDYQEAADQASLAFRTRTADIDIGDLVDRGLLAVSCLVKARRLDEAAAVHAEVEKLIERLRGFTTWTPDEMSQLADQHAARAVRILVHGLGPLRARARAAVEHLEMAIGLDGTVPWYRLEIAFAELAAGRTQPAAAAFAAAAAQTDDDMLRSAIEALASG
jgi:tetratricopeptide (TPR) repeat protein